MPDEKFAVNVPHRIKCKACGHKLLTKTWFQPNVKSKIGYLRTCRTCMVKLQKTGRASGKREEKPAPAPEPAPEPASATIDVPVRRKRGRPRKLDTVSIANEALKRLEPSAPGTALPFLLSRVVQALSLQGVKIESMTVEDGALRVRYTIEEVIPI